MSATLDLPGNALVAMTRDSLAALISRYDAGYFKPVASLDSPYLARLQIPDSRLDSPLSRSSSFLGRAPPASILAL